MGPKIFSLGRFLEAQEGIYDGVTAELAAGLKASHWMWFVFPQVSGLGSSPWAKLYAIESEAEAAAYAAHPVLGARLRECSSLVMGTRDRSADDIFGAVDARKFQSSMTLFQAAAPDEPLFTEALQKFYSGDPDSKTESILARWRSQS